jgi:hypothetical protein
MKTLANGWIYNGQIFHRSRRPVFDKMLDFFRYVTFLKFNVGRCVEHSCKGFIYEELRTHGKLIPKIVHGRPRILSDRCLVLLIDVLDGGFACKKQGLAFHREADAFRFGYQRFEVVLNLWPTFSALH